MKKLFIPFVVFFILAVASCNSENKIDNNSTGSDSAATYPRDNTNVSDTMQQKLNQDSTLPNDSIH